MIRCWDLDANHPQDIGGEGSYYAPLPVNPPHIYRLHGWSMEWQIEPVAFAATNGNANGKAYLRGNGHPNQRGTQTMPHGQPFLDVLSIRMNKDSVAPGLAHGDYTTRSGWVKLAKPVDVPVLGVFLNTVGTTYTAADHGMTLSLTVEFETIEVDGVKWYAVAVANGFDPFRRPVEVSIGTPHLFEELQ